MECNDLISIVLPIYNVDTYLQECIDSVLRQTYQKLEIILVDDGSTDRSGLICDENAKKDTRIIVVHKKNGGLSDARNAGIDIAKGKYIAFVDSDDYVNSRYIEDLYFAISKEEADVAICSYEYTDEAGVPFNYERMTTETVRLSGKDVLERAMKADGVGYIVVWNKLYKRDIFKNLRYEKGLIYEDEYINFKLFWDCHRVVMIPKALYYYRQRQGSIQSSKVDFNRISMQHDLYIKRIAFYREKNEKHLLIRALQSYYNWATRCFSDKDKTAAIPRPYTKQIQQELRDSIVEVLSSKELNLIEKSQDFMGAANIRFAGYIKGWLKRG